MKKCITCKVEKELSQFTKDKSRKDGLINNCRTCNSNICKKWYENNKERKKESSKKWHENNKEHVYNLNRTSEAKYTNLKASAKTRSLELQISFEQYAEIIKESKCYYCDASLVGTTGSSLNRIDSNKGYLVENVKPCCGTCNSIMNNYSIEELSNRVYKIVARMKKLQKENK